MSPLSSHNKSLVTKPIVSEDAGFDNHHPYPDDDEENEQLVSNASSMLTKIVFNKFYSSYLCAYLI